MKPTLKSSTSASKKEELTQPLLCDTDHDSSPVSPPDGATGEGNDVVEGNTEASSCDRHQDNLPCSAGKVPHLNLQHQTPQRSSSFRYPSSPPPAYTVLPTCDSHVDNHGNQDRNNLANQHGNSHQSAQNNGATARTRSVTSQTAIIDNHRTTIRSSHRSRPIRPSLYEDEGLGGGCSCSWSLPGWSTPPGGDQQKSRRRRALIISCGIIGGILCVLATVCHYSGAFDIIRKEANATFHTLNITVSKTIRIQIYADSLSTIESSSIPTNTTPSPILNLTVGTLIPQHIPYFLKYNPDGSSIQLDFKNFASMDIAHVSEKQATDGPQFHCYDITWKNKGAHGCTFHDALELGDAHWFGGAPIKKLTWPMETWDQGTQAFITGDSNKGFYGGIQERYWLSSKGIAVHVNQQVPLFVGVNHHKSGLLSLQSKCEAPYTREWLKKPDFKYTLCHTSDSNIVSVHKKMSAKFIPKPRGIPDRRIFNQSIWTTWDTYKKSVDQKSVLDFASQIHKHGFCPAQFEIDDDWTPHYGDLDFDSDKFPDPLKMVQDMKEMGFRVTLWAHPFASPFSHAFYEGARKNYWVKNWLIDIPSIVAWSDGLGSILDVTNPKAIEWFTDKLTSLQSKYGIHSFKFDNGEASSLPSWRRTHKAIHNPNDFTAHYVHMAHQADPNNRSQEVLAGIQTQDLPMFTRIKDKYPVWDEENGLKTLIPHVLTFGIVGYPFVLPDIIGGNVYKGLSAAHYPDRELYIRWVQAAALLPVMQFSIPPWHYDDEVNNITKRMYRLHQNYAEKLIQLAEESTKTGEPIVRPLWWLCPQNEACLTSDSQFLVGVDLLVAPVLQEGARKRDVFLPSGSWQDQVNGGVYQGPGWIKEHPARLEDLPHFLLISK